METNAQMNAETVCYKPTNMSRSVFGVCGIYLDSWFSKGHGCLD